MTDRFLFVVSPYLTAAASVPGCVVRYMLWTRREARAGSERSDARATPIRSAWRWAVGLVAAGHLLALALPGMVLRWNQQPLRLLALEGAGLAAGIVALAALMAIAVQRARRSQLAAVQSPADVIAWTLLVIELLSGLAIAVFYRWGSSWSAVTIAPYLRSLVRLDPDTVLVARLPLPARLHLFCAFALVAVVPFTRVARAVIAAADRAARWIAARAASIVPSWCAFDDLSARMQPLRVRLTRHEEEEN